MRAVALLTALDLEEARPLARAVGLELARIEPLAAGSVNSNFLLHTTDGRRFFARLYEEQGRGGAEAEVRLVTTLAEQGVPVVQSLQRGDGALVGEYRGKPFAVFPWVEGEILCQGRVDEGAAGRLGAALARVHLATPFLARPGEGRFRIPDLRERLARIDREAPGAYARDTAFIRERLARYEAERARLSAPQGVIHSDLFRDNVLWQDGELAALLDFESACYGAFAYDVMTTLCAWCYGDRFSLPLVRAFLGGYHAVRRIDAEEREALRVEGAIACLRFATTRITDFSMRAAPGQKPVRDYRRFLARLAALEGGELDGAISEALR